MSALPSALCVTAAVGFFAAASPASAVDATSGIAGSVSEHQPASENPAPKDDAGGRYTRTDPDITATGYTNDNGKGGSAARGRTQRKALRDTQGSGNANTRGVADPAFDTRADASGTPRPNKTASATTTGAIQ